MRPGEVEIVLKNPGFPLSGEGGGNKKASALPLDLRDSGDQMLAHWQIWGDRRMSRHIATLEHNLAAI